MKATVTNNGERVVLTNKARDLGHGVQIEVIYQDETKGWEHEDDLIDREEDYFCLSEDLNDELNIYKVTSAHDVYVDIFEEGEGDYVNSYSLSSEIEATNWRDAIEKYFEKYLFFEVNLNHGYIDDDSNTFHYFNLVNDDDMEASDKEIEQWKENKLTLYSNHTEITVHQLIEINLK